MLLQRLILKLNSLQSLASSPKKSAGSKTGAGEISRLSTEPSKSTGDLLPSDITYNNLRAISTDSLTASVNHPPCLHCLRRIHTSHKDGIKRLDVLKHCKRDPSSTARCQACKDAHRCQSECVPVPTALFQQAQVLIHDALEYYDEKQEVDSALKEKSKQFHAKVTEALAVSSADGQ